MATVALDSVERASGNLTALPAARQTAQRTQVVVYHVTLQPVDAIQDANLVTIMIRAAVPASQYAMMGHATEHLVYVKNA